MQITTDTSVVVEALNQGKVGVIPSDTVYGLAAKASNREAVARLYALKSRERKPGTLVAATIDQLVELGLKRRYLVAVAQYWPGPVSVIIPSDSSLDYLHLGLHGLATRIPSNDRLQAILQQTGPLITSSANLPGEPVANTVDDAVRYFGEKVDFYLDGGDLSGHQPSTLVRIIDDAIEVLREGAVTISPNQ